MERSEPVSVLIAGGGVAALEAALALRALAEDRVNVELLAPEPHFWYRPMAVAEPFRLGEARHFELPQLAAAAGATFVPGAVVSVDTGRHVAHTSAGAAHPYDVLLLACGAMPVTAIPGALTFRGPADVGKMTRLLDEAEDRMVRQIAFVVPWGAVWSLPIYELALLTANHLAARGLRDVELALVTPEDEPLQLFGLAASAAVGVLLDERGVAVHTRSYAREVRDGELRLVPHGVVTADRVVALPRLVGRRIDGIPQTVEGFVPVDAHSRVPGVADVYAAGDVTTFPVKQGGIAAQQAETAAQAIAAAVGVRISPAPFRPVLRGLLITGAEPRFLRREITGGAGEESWAGTEPLWWPPAKIVGRYLAPFLGALAGVDAPSEQEPPPGAVPVELELGERDVERLAGRGISPAVEAADERVPKVRDVVTGEPLIVAPEDTLGEVAEKLRERDVGSALVAEYGTLIGILTSRDLLRAFAGRVHSSEARVREWMTAEPVSVTADTSIEAAAILMAEHDIHHLPVVENERPVGMVGMRDLVRAAPFEGSRPGIGLGF